MIDETVNKIRSQEIKAEDLVKDHVAKAQTTGKNLNAFLTVLEDAVEQARKIDEKIAQGEQVGKLAGIPFSAKDIFMTKGITTTAGSQLLEDFKAPYTATVVQRLLDEDAILIGKTNCDPFAFGGSGENSGYGATLNPIANSRVPGGSSSGAAAAQAAEIGMFAIGTDTGGSVRQPGAFCGIPGFKPTYGRNSRYGLIAMASSFDTAGILANNIEDIAYVEEIIAGKDPRDATTYEVEVENYSEALKNTELKGKKFALPKQYFAEGIEQEVAAKVKTMAENLQAAGAEVTEVDLPILKHGLAAYYVLVPSEISSNMARFDGVRYGKKVSDDYQENLFQSRGKYLEDEVRRRIMVGTYALSKGYADRYYHQAAKVRAKITQKIRDLFKSYDAVIGPTTPTTAFELGSRTEDPVQMYLTDMYTVIANLTGCPAISINAGQDSNGLPIGFQFMANRFEETQLLQFAKATTDLIQQN